MLDIDIGSAVQLQPGQTEQHGQGCDREDEPKAGRAVLASMMRHGDALELVAVSEEGFTASVLKHAREIHKSTVRLGLLHEVETGFLERVNSTILGVT